MISKIDRFMLGCTIFASMKILRLTLSLFLSLFALKGYPQAYINPSVDTSFTEVKVALRFYQEYLSAFQSEKLPDLSLYWPASELKSRKIPVLYILKDLNQPFFMSGPQQKTCRSKLSFLMLIQRVT
jgi:hypothetical protein